MIFFFGFVFVFNLADIRLQVTTSLGFRICCVILHLNFVVLSPYTIQLQSITEYVKVKVARNKMQSQSSNLLFWNSAFQCVVGESGFALVVYERITVQVLSSSVVFNFF